MPNILDETGLQTQTRAELVQFYTEKYQEIYGSDINLDSDSPDGQMMNINVQVVLDLLDLLTQIFSSMDPDNAIGVVLDQRVAINNIQRLGGSYTITPITLVNSLSVNLYGVDQELEPVYTIADSSGTTWVLITTVLGLAPGTHTLNFRAALPGRQLTTPNTINVPVSVILGVTSVNNPSSPLSLGQDEETDGQLKVRRTKAVSLPAVGLASALEAALENLDGVTSAKVYENATGETDVNGVPGHSIWVIVSGSPDPDEVANTIYVKRSTGSGMKGDTTRTITQADGSSFVVKWDTVLSQNLFITMTLSSIDGINVPNVEAIKEGIVLNYIPSVFSEVDINGLATVVQTIDPNALVTGAGFTTAQTQVITLSGVAASGTFKIRYDGNDSAAINWNDAIGVVQTKLQAIPGLSGALVTGSIAGQALTFNLTAIDSVLSLLTIEASTLQTAGLTFITYTYVEGFQNVLEPQTKRYQFVLAEDQIIVLPLILTPISTNLAAAGTIQFTALGGYGTYTYSILVNNSGGSINAANGFYVAGLVGSVSDTIRVTDSFGNVSSALVSLI